MAETATQPARTEPTPAETPKTTPPATPMLRRYDPFEMIESFQDEMARLWGHTWPFSGRPLPRRAPTMPEGTVMGTTWTPRVDVFEKDGDLVVKAELPGAKKEDIDITLDKGMLVIRGQKKAESEVKEEHYYRMERSYGSLYRRLPLPFETTPEAITATFADGVLEVHVPKPPAGAEPTSKSITII